MSKIITTLLFIASFSAAASVEFKVYDKHGLVVANDFNASSICSGKGYDRNKTEIVHSFELYEEKPSYATSIVHPNGELADKVIIKAYERVNMLNVVRCSL